MKTCCICGSQWKDRKNENKPRECDHTLIYGCVKCNKGFSEKNRNRGDFQYGECTKKGDN